METQYIIKCTEERVTSLWAKWGIGGGVGEGFRGIGIQCLVLVRVVINIAHAQVFAAHAYT